MPAFTGQLRSNEIFAALFNMIISQQVYADNIKEGYDLVDKARVDGSLFGDTKLYYSTDALHSHKWGADSEASNLLALARPKAPEQQAIVLDQFFQIDLTVDYYLSKRAWGSEGAFTSFTSVMIGWLSNSKKVIDSTTYNAYIGTAVSAANKAVVSVGIASAISGLTGVEARQMEAMTIAEALANLFVQMKDYSRDFNDYKHIRNYAMPEIKVVWNAAFSNKIKKIDLPTIFHKEGLMDKFEEEILPARFFGVVIDSSNISNYSASTPTTGKPIDSDDHTYVPGSNHANGLIRTMVEKSVTVGGTKYDLYPGDEIPAGATIVASTGDFLPGEVYLETSDVICKVMTEYVPFMSAFEVGTNFFNPKSLTETHFLTWGRNSLEYLKGKPFITVKAA